MYLGKADMGLGIVFPPRILDTKSFGGVGGQRQNRSKQFTAQIILSLQKVRDSTAPKPPLHDRKELPTNHHDAQGKQTQQRAER